MVSPSLCRRAERVIHRLDDGRREAEAGSSSSSSFGSLISARPTASIWRSPPDIVPARWRRRSASRGKSVNTRSSSARYAALSRSGVAPSSRLFSTRLLTNSRQPSGDRASPGARSHRPAGPRDRLAARFDRPRLTGTSPAMAFSVVVLPAPLEPSRATMLPSGTSQRDVGDADQIAVADFQMLDRRAAARSWSPPMRSACPRWRACRGRPR